MSDSILTRIRNLVAGKKQHAVAEATQEKAPPVLQFGTVSAEDVLREERGMEGQSLFQGRVFVLDLEPFFDAIGSTSSRTAQNLIFMCENILSQRLGHGGAHSLYDDQIFIFRFEDEDDPEGWKKAKEIINEIGVNFFGESFKPGELGTDMISEIDAAELVDAVGEVNVDKVRKIVLPFWSDEEESEEEAWDYGSKFGPARERDPQWQKMGEDAPEGEAEYDFTSRDRPEPNTNWESMGEGAELDAPKYKDLEYKTKRVQHSWEVQQYKKRPIRKRVKRGPQRRTGQTAHLYTGPNRRKQPHGRRAEDDPRQVVW